VTRGRGWPVPRLARDMVVLVVAVVIGGIAGALTHRLASQWTSPDTARNIALAVATTVTGSSHARLVHRQPLTMVVPTAAVSVPIVYLAMYIVHVLVAP
jgi:hypothetical protein